MINFRYTIIEKLGEGGSGEVFRVHDRFKHNQLLAMKVLHRGTLGDTETNEIFQNEFFQLLHLSHPNLVRVFDCGIVRQAKEDYLLGRRFFTMEFVQGLEALDWVRANVTRGQKEAVLGTVLMQVLSVLDYIHAEGIIHFDVKPQNLILIGGKDSSDHPLVKLMDFGFSKKFDETLNVSIRGTLEYTAPELLKGESFDHRVDLYSVGATFFHLLEGRCPFEAGDPVELVKRILSDEVTFQSSDGGFLQPIVKNLLEKNPERRFASASEAAYALSRQLPNGKEVLESYFGRARKPKFVGRRIELQTIQKALEALRVTPASAEPSAIALTGGEGIGKTSLLREATKAAHLLQLPVYELEARSRDVPFQAIASVLPILASNVRSYSESGAAFVERFSSVFDCERPNPLPPDLGGQKTEEYIERLSRFIIGCSDISPLVIVADNFSEVDEQTVLVLRTVLRDVPSHRIVVLTAETGTSPRLTAFSGRMIHVPLHELELSDVEELSVSVLRNGDAARQAAKVLFELYGGTPVVLVEALNALLDVVSGPGGRAEEGVKALISYVQSNLPRTVDQFLLARFQKLSRERQLVLNVLSCFKFPVRIAVLNHVLPFHRLRSADHIRFLLLEGFLGTAENDRLLYIRQNRLKETIYQRIGDDRIELHTLIATTLERHHEENDFTELQELAHQHALAAMPLQASFYFRRAAEIAVDLFALHKAHELLQRAIEEAERAGETERVTILRVRHVSVLYKAGLFKEAVEKGLEIEPQEGLDTALRRIVLKSIGLSLSRLGETDRAREYIMRALELSTEELEQLELRQELVGLQIAAGHFQEAEQESHRQLERASRLNNSRLQGAIYTDLGIASFFQDKHDDAIRYFREALRTYDLLNEKSQVINAINNIGNALSAKGEYEEAIQYWERALQASKEYGTLNQQSQIYNNLGIAHYNLKHYPQARDYYVAALDISSRAGSRLNLAIAMNNLGEVHMVEGDYERALDLWSNAGDIFRELDHLHWLAETMINRAEALERSGLYKEMPVYLDAAARLMTANPMDSLLERHTYLAGVWRQKSGDYGKAEERFVAIRGQGKKKTSGFYVLASLRLGELYIHQRKFSHGISILQELEDDPRLRNMPALAAELDYLFGILAKASSEASLEKPIVYFKRGMERIASEPVSEITWKLAYALGLEYYERGQMERAREFLHKAQVVLEFFLSHFRSEDLKRQYLAADHRDRVLATIESILDRKQN